MKQLIYFTDYIELEVSWDVDIKYKLVCSVQIASMMSLLKPDVPDQLPSPESSGPVCSWMWQVGNEEPGSHAGWNTPYYNHGAESSGCFQSGGSCSWWMKRKNPFGSLSAGARCCDNRQAETPGEPERRPLEGVWCECWRCLGWTLVEWVLQLLQECAGAFIGETKIFYTTIRRMYFHLEVPFVDCSLKKKHQRDVNTLCVGADGICDQSHKIRDQFR